MDNDNLRLKPYDRLRSILNDGDFTERASDNLDKILDIKKEDTILDKAANFFKKIDSFIFRKPNVYSNNPHKRKH